MLEAGQHPAAFFVTLTYKDSELPDGGNLSKRDVQLYLKRLRADVAPRRIRYFACGEYGDESGRAHYHLALFGALVPREIRQAWGKGLVDISLLGPESAGYICGYILKQGLKSDSRAEGREPEFRRMSRRPGIGGYAADEMGKRQREFSAVGEDVANVVRMGGKAWPLGRYMRERIRGAGAVAADGVQFRRDMERAMRLLTMTSKDVADLARLRQVDRAKGERAAIRAAASQREIARRKKL